jgi:hypothetical protein
MTTKRSRTDEVEPTPADDDSVLPPPTKKTRFADLKRQRDETYAAYQNIVRVIGSHPDFALHVLPPVMTRRFLATGRLTKVKVSSDPEEGVEVTFYLDGEKHRGWCMYELRQSPECRLNNSDLEELLDHPEKTWTDAQLQSMLDTEDRRPIYQHLKMPFNIEADFIEFALIKLSDAK